MAYGSYYGGQQTGLQSDEVKAKNKELKTAQNRTQQVKRQIEFLRRQLDTSVDYEIVRKLEDEIQAKRQKYEALEDQFKQLVKVGTHHNEAIRELNKEHEMKERLDQVKQESAEAKRNLREVGEKQRVLDEQAKQNHKLQYDMQERIRNISILVKQAKKRPVPLTTEEEADPDEAKSLEELERELASIKQRREADEAKMKLMMKGLQDKNAKVKQQIEVEEIQLRDKDKELRAKDLKLKELRAIAK